LSTQEIYKAVIHTAIRRLGGVGTPPIKHLDIGAGRGELVRAISGKMSCTSFACDYHVELFQATDVPMSAVDLNKFPLPYPDGAFDLVTCSEVVEHLENYRHLFREAYRVLNPGGVFVVTTPNVLNMNSRVRYLLTGFGNLFGPLPIHNERLNSAGGHITPIPYFYLAHGLADAGFVDIEANIDKIQRTSVGWLGLLFPVVILGWQRFLRRERKRYKTLNAENEPYVSKHISWNILVGRSIVCSAIKPKG
jgi:SAM-dependent methyltransferase